MFYTWSRSIDNQSDPLVGDFFDLGISNQTDRTGAAVRSSFTQANDREADRGNSDFDQRHNFVLFSYWEPAELYGKRVKAISRNWRIAETLVIRSGLPYSVYARDPACQPLCNTRADLLAPALVSAVTGNPEGGKLLLNASAFGFPAVGVNGNTGRNAFTGPGFWNLDLSLSRTFAIPKARESTRLEVRADAFNVLNHANLQPPANYLGPIGPAGPIPVPVPSYVRSDFGTALFGRTGNKSGFPALTPFAENSRQVQILVRLQF